MSERVLVEFECPKHHLFARVVATHDGTVVVFPAIAYLDVGNRPGTVRHRREPEEHRQTLVDDNWSHTVICSCKRPQLLTQGEVEIQLREWKRFNSRSPKPRRIVLRTRL